MATSGLVRLLPRACGIPLTLALCAGCGEGEPPSGGDSSVAEVTLSVVNDTLLVQSFLQLVATPRDAEGDALTGRTVEWSSSAPELATVSSAGEVHARALGIITITATAEGKSATATLTLAPVITVLRRLPTSFAGDTTRLTATLADANGVELTGPPVEWTSSDGAVATVSAAGIVTALAAGSAVIRASVSGGAGEEMLVVLEPVTRPNRAIAYTSGEPGAQGVTFNRVRLLPTDGSPATPVTPADQEVRLYRWSPTGDRLLAIYVTRNEVGRFGLFTIDPDGSDERTVVVAGIWDANWSPDGQRMAYSTGEVVRIWTVRADGVDLRHLTSLPGHQFNPVWSPDSRRIAFLRSDDFVFGGELWVMDANGDNQEQIATPTGASEIAWSPDGKTIAFTSFREGESQGVWAVNADGTAPRPLSPNCSVEGTCSGPRGYADPSWSPDGSRLAIVSSIGGNSDIAIQVVDPAGNPMNAFDIGSVVSSLVDWSPDGTMLAYTAPQQGVGFPSIVISRPDGSGRVELTGNEFAGTATWQR